MPLFPGDRPPIIDSASKVGGSRGRALRSGFDLLMRLLRRRGGNTVSMDELSRVAEHSDVQEKYEADLRRAGGEDVERSIGFTDKTESDLLTFTDNIAAQDLAIDDIIDDADAVEWYSTGNDSPEDRRMLRRRLGGENPRLLQDALDKIIGLPPPSTDSAGRFRQSIRDELNRALNRARK